MTAFWRRVATGLTKAAVWAADHPDQVIAIVQAAKSAKAGG